MIASIARTPPWPPTAVYPCGDPAGGRSPSFRPSAIRCSVSVLARRPSPTGSPPKACSASTRRADALETAAGTPVAFTVSALRTADRILRRCGRRLARNRLHWFSIQLITRVCPTRRQSVPVTRSAAKSLGSTGFRLSSKPSAVTIRPTPTTAAAGRALRDDHAGGTRRPAHRLRRASTPLPHALPPAATPGVLLPIDGSGQ